MLQTKNPWIRMKTREIEALKRKLIEYDFSGSYGGAVNFMQIVNMINGCVTEILKLQLENENLKAELKKAIKKNEG